MVELGKGIRETGWGKLEDVGGGWDGMGGCKSKSVEKRRRKIIQERGMMEVGR